MNRSKIIAVISVVISVILLASCDKNHQKSITEMKKDQEKYIKEFRASHGISVKELSKEELPSTIDEKVFYKFPNGLYMRVLDKGTEKPEKDKTHVFVKLKGFTFETDTLDRFNNLNDPSYQPIEFIYTYYYDRGDFHYRQVKLDAPRANLDAILCEGIAFPMSLLGNGARVQLIIPFQIGPNATYNNGYPYFIEEAEYNFHK